MNEEELKMTKEELLELLKGCLFIVGAQVTADGDIVPSTFTIFPKTSNPTDATIDVLGKITDDMQELGINDTEGTLAFKPIKSWEQFADLKVSDEVKVQAWVEAVLRSYLDLQDMPTMREIILLPWKDDSDDL